MRPSPTAKTAAAAARKAAEAAAQHALAARVALVGAIGEAHAAAAEVVDEKQALEERFAADLAAIAEKQATADASIQQAYDIAVAGGWSVKELTAMGYTAPKKPRKPRKSSDTPANTAAADPGAGPADQSSH